MIPNIMLPAEPRVFIGLKLKCTCEECNRLSDQIEDEMRVLAEDPTLSIKDLHRASVTLVLDCSETACTNTISLFKAGQLRRILGIEVLDVQKVHDLKELSTGQAPESFLSKLIALEKHVFSIAEGLANLHAGQLFDRVLGTIVAISILGGVELLFRALWVPLLADIAVGGFAMSTLVWRIKKKGVVGRRRKREGFSLYQWSFIATLTLFVLIAIGRFSWNLGKLYRNQLSVSHFHKELKDFGLPGDLYDHQGQLHSLSIEQGALTDLDWLDSAALTDLTIANSGLHSVNGVTHTPELQSLDIDLKRASLESLAGISFLHRLRELTIRNISGAKGQLASVLGTFPDLRKLNLDFERSSIATLPDLAGLQELQDLTLNLRAITAIAEPPDLSGLRQLHSLFLFVDNSKIRSLKPLAKLEHLQTLTLALDGTQLGLLQGWLAELTDRPGPQSLTLFFTTPPNADLPNFGGIRNLISLGITTPGSEPPARTPILDTRHLDGLRQLTVSAENSEISVLPDIRRLIGLLTLNLDLEASKVTALPDISQLHELQQLTFNLTATAVGDLPDFAQIAPSFPRLRDLDLQLARSQIRSLRGIDHLRGLRSLSLNISGVTINDLGSLANISSLEKLTLRLQWSQVGTLPDLAPLKNLSELELDLDDWFKTERLPDLMNLPNLRKLRLVLENSHDVDLSSLEKISGLAELYLDLKGSSVEILPDLRSLNNLHRVAMDLRHSRIQLNQTLNLKALEELTIDNTFSTLEDLPQSVKKLVIAP